MEGEDKNNAELMDLPNEILLNIFSRLPAKSICRIQCASKAMFNTVAIDNQHLAKLHTRSLIDTNSMVEEPQLMFFAQCQRPGTTGGLASLQSVKYDGGALTQGKFNPITVSASKKRYEADYQMHFAYCNLFCLKKCFGHPFLIDPLRGEVLRLPASDIYRKYGSGTDIINEWLGMGFDSLTNTHKIVWDAYVESGRTNEACHAVQVLVLGTSAWREIRSSLPIYLSPFDIIKNVCAHGDMHWFIFGTRKGIEGNCHIVSFDFKKEKFCWTPHPTLTGRKQHLNLITLRGSMAIVDTNESGYADMSLKIWVMKDYDKKVWTQDYLINISVVGVEFAMHDIIFCGEWEDGIFFTESGEQYTAIFSPKNYTTTLFFNLKTESINRVIFPFGNAQWKFTRIITYTESLISLKDYGISVEADPQDCYGNLIQGEAGNFRLIENEMVQGISSFLW